MAWRSKVKAMLIARDMRKIVHMMTGPWTAASFGLAAFLTLTACGAPTPTQGVNDHYEATNRQVHAFNRAVDKNIVRPIARSTTKIVPEPVQQGVVNFADNLDLPGSVVNDVLQARLDRAVENTLRFGINSTIGIAGLFDPATKMGLPAKATDFGETLYVWGATEGNYLELPLLGPSTERDAFGKVVDMALNPLRLLVPDMYNIPTYAKIASKLADRGRYSETVDSILYDSADSYAQARLLYLDHRRFNLGQAPSEDQFEDPYAQ